MSNVEPQVGTVMHSLDPRDDGRAVRVIELHYSEITGHLRKIRVENTRTERRTFLSWPLTGSWIWSKTAEVKS